jgi:benzoyl-CoA 2,3-dioxygenase component B
VLKALEKWHPGYINWWNDLIPQNFQEALVYLRTAVSVDPKGWAKFDYVKMPEYRWGVLLAPQVEDRRSPAASITASRPGRRCRANTATCSSG